MSDNGKLNERILAKEAKQDYLGRVEAPRKRVSTRLASPEAKRLFVRFFDSMQMNTNFVSNIARSRLKHEDVEQVEALIQAVVDKGLAEINQALDAAEALCKAHHISEFAEYDQDPLEQKVGVISSLSRQYLDLIIRFDQLMPMLATLEIDGIITKKELDLQVAGYKKLAKRVAYSTRELANGVRKRMNQLTAQVENVPAHAEDRSAKVIPMSVKAVADAEDELATFREKVEAEPSHSRRPDLENATIPATAP